MSGRQVRVHCPPPLRTTTQCHTHLQLTCSVAVTRVSLSEFLLLDRLLRRFSTPRGAVSLLPPTSGRLTARHAAQITGLLGMLFSVLEQETQNQVDALFPTHSEATETPPSAAGGEEEEPPPPSPPVTTGGAGAGAGAGHIQPPRPSTTGAGAATAAAAGRNVNATANVLLQLGGRLLGSYQRHLLSLATEGDSASYPPCRILTLYGQLLFESSCRVLRHCIVRARAAGVTVDVDALMAEAGNAANNGVEGNSPDDAPRVRQSLVRVLAASIVGSLLPAFATATCLFLGKSWLAATLLPKLATLAKELDELNAGLAVVATHATADSHASARGGGGHMTEAPLRSKFVYVAALVCGKCSFLEFPGCTTHGILLNVPDGTGHFR